MSAAELSQSVGASADNAIKLIWFAALDKYVMPPQLVRSVIVSGSLMVVYGASNSGKTFFVLDLALHVSYGKPWRGFRTTPGLVLYVAGEGASSVRTRVAAFRREHPEWPADLPFAVIPQAVNMLNPESMVGLLAVIREAEAQAGCKVGLVIIDTLARSMPGGDENAPKDMGLAVATADALRQETGAAVLLVHHTGKDLERGSRGHSSLKAAIDTEIEVASEKDHRVAKVTKQRDLDTGLKMAFSLKIVEVGFDSETGDPVTSCVVVHSEETHSGQGAVEQSVRELMRGSTKRRLREALQRESKADPERIWSIPELRSIAAETKMHRNSIKGAIEALRECNLLQSTSGGYLFRDRAD